MFVAYTKEGVRVHINDYVKYTYPVYCLHNHELCGHQGEIKKWHYAHKGIVDCIFNQGKSEFHLWWQNRINKDALEVRIQNDKVKHIADIMNKDGLVIEIQHSIMSPGTIKERESFYDTMIWIFDITTHNVDIVKKYKDLVVLKINRGNLYFSEANKTHFLDMGFQGLFEVLRKKGKTFLCRKITLDAFDKRYFLDIVLDNRDMRIDKPYFDMSLGSATEKEIKAYKI